MNQAKYAYLALMGIVALWILGTSIIAIPAGEIGVVTQFGKVTGRELLPGLNVKAPLPFQSVWIADTRVQKDESDASAASADLQEVRSVVALNYHLKPEMATDIYQTIGPDFKSRLVDPAIQEAVKATTAKFTASELLTKRPQVKEEVKVALESRLAPRGIVVDDFSIINFEFSTEFNKAIEQKQIAQQQAERAQYNLEAARKDAEAQAAQKESLTREILMKQAIEKWDGHLPQYVGSGDSIFNIPLR